MDYPTFLLEARSITKSFGPTSVLKGFDLSIAPAFPCVADAAGLAREPLVN
jgi:hypothetical protein